MRCRLSYTGRGVAAVVALVLGLTPTSVGAKPHALNTVGVDLPLDGGGFLTYSRDWELNRTFSAGATLGGGVIDQDFDVRGGPFDRHDANARSVIFPFIGPYIALNSPFATISATVGAFWSRTDLDVKNFSGGRTRGHVSGWGTAAYTPLLFLAYYSKKRNMVFGVGFSGFWASGYPDVSIDVGNGTTTPVHAAPRAISFHLSTTWSGKRIVPQPEDDFE